MERLQLAKNKLEGHSYVDKQTSFEMIVINVRQNEKSMDEEILVIVKDVKSQFIHTWNLELFLVYTGTNI